MLSQLSRVSRIILAAGLVGACSTAAGQAPVPNTDGNSGEPLKFDKCEAAFADPSLAGCFACLQELIANSNASYPAGGPSLKGCIDAAALGFQSCLDRIEDERPGGDSRLDVWVGGDRGDEPRRPSWETPIADTRSMFEFAVIVHGEQSQAEQIGVYTLNADGQLDRLERVVVSLLGEVFAANVWTIAFKASDLHEQNGFAVAIVALHDSETRYPVRVKPFVLEMTDSYDLNGDGSFDDLDRGIAMNKHAAGEISYKEMAAIVNAE